MATGDIFTQQKVNDIHRALKGDLVGRGTYNAPASGKNLGSSTYQWEEINAGAYYLSGLKLSGAIFLSGHTAIFSGDKRLDGNRASFLRPSGSELSVTILASRIPIIFKVANQIYRCNADITITGLTAGPSSSHTCAVNESTASDEERTKYAGELYNGNGVFSSTSTRITVQTMGATMSAKVGTFQTLKNDVEYFYAFIQSTVDIRKAQRGYFFDEDASPISRQPFTNADTFTLMGTGWIFLNKDGATTYVTYNVPIWQAETPSSPATGDFWYDMANQIWKRYNGSSYVDSECALLGMIVLSDTACVAARTMEFASLNFGVQNIELEKSGSTHAKAVHKFSSIDAESFKRSFDESLESFDTSEDFASVPDTTNISMTGTLPYYLYITSAGRRRISDTRPVFRLDRTAWFHPHQDWKCIGGIDVTSGALVNPFTYPNNYDLITKPRAYIDVTSLSTSSPATIPFTNSSTQTNGVKIDDTNERLYCYDSGIYEIALFLRPWRTGGGPAAGTYLVNINDDDANSIKQVETFGRLFDITAVTPFFGAMMKFDVDLTAGRYYYATMTDSGGGAGAIYLADGFIVVDRIAGARPL